MIGRECTKLAVWILTPASKEARARIHAWRAKSVVVLHLIFKEKPLTS